ncbi:helix-turn-helix domain-containing protein [Emticicia sp. SJ17W-69]|uniref:helix-turn-helix domain-containing protein n=1 Tax=Emticicia sp. SJ17W-69 TaxID=3421657 RepID=UPI003EB70F1B
MAVEILTKDDLQQFKSDLFAELKKAIKENPTTNSTYLQSFEVRKMLNISPGTLQHLRVSGQLPYTKLGGKIFYDSEDIRKMIEKGKVK